MLLAVDVGNTEIVLGVFRGEELVHTWRVSGRPERTPDELVILFANLLERSGLAFDPRHVDAVVVSSVVPPVTQALREAFLGALSLDPEVVGPGTRTGLSILTDDPREVGADRVVSALAAFTRYGGPAIVVDFGTATTYDVVSAKGEYLGGAIAPGLQVSWASLFSATARLTQVELVAPRSVIGTSTVESLRSGLVFGTAAEVDGMVGRIGEHLGGDAKVIATGGLADVVVPHCRTIDEHDPWLTLEGLRLVHERNPVPTDG
jgi:type III pantothenate kinase